MLSTSIVFDVIPNTARHGHKVVSTDMSALLALLFCVLFVLMLFEWKF